MRLTFKVNGVDYSPLINKYSFSFDSEKRTGNNGGVMKDGSMVQDILAYKTVISAQTNGARSADLKSFLQLLIGDEVLVTFYDDRLGVDRTATFFPDVGTRQVAMYKGDNIVWFNAITIKLTEK